MGRKINYFSVYMRKIEGTENDYELVTSLNPMFKTLPEDKIRQIEDITLKAVQDVKAILRSK